MGSNQLELYSFFATHRLDSIRFRFMARTRLMDGQTDGWIDGRTKWVKLNAPFLLSSNNWDTNR